MAARARHLPTRRTSHKPRRAHAPTSRVPRAVGYYARAQPRLHYDEILAEKHSQKTPVRRVVGSVLSYAAYTHRKQLNQKLVLPDSVKEILRCPRDEVSPAKMELLCVAVRREIEGEAVVYLRTDEDIESLAAAVETCCSTDFADEVGKDTAAIPKGARISVEVDEGLPLQKRRCAIAALVGSMREGDPVRAMLRPLGTSREPPLDTFARELMRRPYRKFGELAGRRQIEEIEEMRDRLLLCLWDALFLSACERWTTEAVSNTTPNDALEMGYWFQRGQQNSKKPLFEGLCAMCGCLLYAGVKSMGNACHGPPAALRAAPSGCYCHFSRPSI